MQPVIRSAGGDDTVPVVVSRAEEVFKITKAANGSGVVVTPVAVQSKAWDPDRAAPYAAQDDCVVAIEDRMPVPVDKLKQLPPWRAVLIARLADTAGVGIERGTLGQLVAEAVAAGGSAVLGDWWERPKNQRTVSESSSGRQAGPEPPG